MGWQRIGGRFLAILGLTVHVGGCAAQTGSQIATRTPDTAALIAAAGSVGSSDGPATEARAQMPENPNNAEPKKTANDLPDTAPTEAVKGDPKGRIVATVNGEVILSEEVEFGSLQELGSIRGLPEPLRSQKLNEVLKTTLENIIDREVVLQEAFARLSGAGKEQYLAKLKKYAREDFDRNWLRKNRENSPAKSDEEFRELLRAQGLNLEMIRRQYERNYMKMEYLRGRIGDLANRIGHPQIEEYYTEHPEDFKIDDGVAWQDLFVDAGRHPNREAARRYAEAIAEKGRAGSKEDFGKLVNEYDNGDSKLRQGAGEGKRRGEISPREAEEALFSLKDGEVRVVEMSSGFHVIRLVKRDYAGLMPFDEKVQRAIADRLKGEIFQREAKRIIADLRHDAIIEYNRK